MRVSVVGTVHEEQGLANVSELHVILERIRPEVIFLEIPSAAFDDFLDGTRSNLESIATRRYRDTHNVVLVPVDLPTPGEEFFRNFEYLRERVRNASTDYRRLIGWDNHYISDYGFAYLNGQRCSELWSEIYAAMQAAIEQLEDHKLIEIFDSWKHTNELRDRAMLKNIEDYCTLNPPENGVFLVGAAHRRSLANKSREGRGVGSLRIEWDFSGFLDVVKEGSV
ncbi:MAG TPA: hypothetical protein VGR67_03475 [Candidatus Polarisedimenticolia bacterium]|jgi:hypothetical protein|nr:hypothetical protein [Candidatus Polarisedimenticolia bacterium]